MKKLFYGAAIALVLVAASCGKSDDNDSNYFSKEATDSLITTFGTAAGYGLNMQITNAMAADSTVTKEAFLKGLQYAMACDTTDAYMNGMITGLQVLTQLKHFSRMGVDVDKNLALNSFKEAFMCDSVPSYAELSAIESKYREWSDSLSKAQRAYQLRKLEEAPEAKENLEKGVTYLNDVKANNDSVKVSATGLGYKIINEGEGAKVSPEGRAMVKYSARTIDGELVDLHNGAAAIVMANRGAGFKEGVSMLGKGGKAVLYVPGNLAYGVEAPQRLRIGPNEMLIYEIEVVDIPAEN